MNPTSNPIMQALVIVLRCLDDDYGVHETTFEGSMRPFVKTSFGDDGLAILDNHVDLADGRFFIPTADDGGRPLSEIFMDIALCLPTGEQPESTRQRAQSAAYQVVYGTPLETSDE